MHKQWSCPVFTQASAFIRFYVRLKSTKARPTAPLGSRILTNPDDIFKHNMWDHVQWTKKDQEAARQKAEENSSIRLPLKEQGKFSTDACQYWDQFYEAHQDKFFKDRRWLFLEFPELHPSSAKEKRTNACHSHQVAAEPASSSSRTNGETGHCRHNDPIQRRQKQIPFYFQEAAAEPNETIRQISSFPGQHASFRILEVGCGVGNSVFPIVNTIKNTDSFLYCCDFSPRAIQLVKDHLDYDDSMCHAFVHDICEETGSFPFPPQSLDVILAVFVLSSIHPQRVQRVVNQLSTYLKHGGVFLFRDYGRYDLSQLRFKKGRCLSDNFYTRGDGTCVYFFTKEEVHDLFSKAGLEEIQNLEDKRLQVNRGKKVAMRRVWMQSKYRKPPLPSPS
ncbi:tRNA N(3)-cytidine methyltransferase METTL8, mitochondrial isoform X1 [Poecilia latipinna]|uniref:tRNA N(3)-cytidine methyltransferase n=1 Tax=Poecilia latipinna TaxID=48699 RepID=A0A3B3UTG2_9TELE|nr:PREDICTED: methyltransferase-like protein 8 isoform X1 [Poecilia latipinna]XP_014900898.1 PREDICTED: methyltransferase-like protein 8 isoform X1 [Poecilia latipinna]